MFSLVRQYASGWCDLLQREGSGGLGLVECCKGLVEYCKLTNSHIGLCVHVSCLRARSVSLVLPEALQLEAVILSMGCVKRGVGGRLS
jgi:hypothetical protein